MEVGPFIREHRAEIRADFRSEYGCSLRGMRPSEVYDLIKMLPPTSRLVRKLNPEYTWPPQEVFLSRLEYELHLLLWSQTKDAKYRRNVPEQILPSGFKRRPRRSQLREDIQSLPIDQLERKLKARRVPIRS